MTFQSIIKKKMNRRIGNQKTVVADFRNIMIFKTKIKHKMSLTKLSYFKMIKQIYYITIKFK